ncbi:hypothetical protein ACMFMG_010451 [Clarireedia jacksonii]
MQSAQDEEEEEEMDTELDDSVASQQKKAVKTIENLHQLLNPTGDVSSAARKCSSITRPDFTKEQFERWIAEMNVNLVKYMSVGGKVEGSFAKDAKNAVLKKVIHFADELESMRNWKGITSNELIFLLGHSTPRTFVHLYAGLGHDRALTS